MDLFYKIIINHIVWQTGLSHNIEGKEVDISPYLLQYVIQDLDR